MNNLTSALHKMRKAYAIINSEDYLDNSNEVLTLLSLAMAEIEILQERYKHMPIAEVFKGEKKGGK